MTSSLDTQLESVPAKPDPLHPQIGWRGSLYVDTPGDHSFAQELSLNHTRSRKVSQNLRKRPELKLNSSTGKIWSMWIRSFAYGFQVIAATVILYALQVTAAWIHRLEVRPMKMVIATLVSHSCRDYLYLQDIDSSSSSRFWQQNRHGWDLRGGGEGAWPANDSASSIVRQPVQRMHLTIPEVKQHDYWLYFTPT